MLNLCPFVNRTLKKHIEKTDFIGLLLSVLFQFVPVFISVLFLI